MLLLAALGAWCLTVNPVWIITNEDIEISKAEYDSQMPLDNLWEWTAGWGTTTTDTEEGEVTVYSRSIERRSLNPRFLWAVAALAAMLVWEMGRLIRDRRYLSPLESTAPSRQRWFRFSFGTMFIMVTFFAVWLGLESNSVRRRQTMRREIEASGGEFVDAIGGNISEARAAEEGYRISVVRKLMGDSEAFTIYFGRFATPDDMKRASYFPEASVYEWFDSFGGAQNV
jgi:hypothetical protein